MVRFSSTTLGLLTGALLVAGCAAEAELAFTAPTPTAVQEPAPEEAPAPTPTPVPDPPGRAELPDDMILQPGPRLAVETADGQIFTVLGDGSNPVPLTDPTEGTVNSHPTWSPDASRLGWITSDPGEDGAWVRSARFDGSDWFEQAMPTAPTSLTFDPSGSQIATLSPGDLGVELGVVSLVERSHRRVDDGSPFWFSWSPDGEGFLVHASGLRLDFVPVEGPSQVLEPVPGSFQAPRWLDGAVQLVYADEQEGQDYLVVAGAQGAGRRALVSYDGYLQFTVAPASGLIALQVVDEDRAPAPDAITASFQDEVEPDIIDPIPRDELTVIATFGGDPFILYPPVDDLFPRPVLAFYWSPDGNSLAWLVEIERGDGDCASETAVYEWQFWTGTAIAPGPRFTPTPTFACDYVPHFDQLDQSRTFWSPDGALLAYAGADPVTGQRGIWTVRPNSFDAPTLVAEGEIAVWSSDNAGSAGQSSR